MRSLSKLHKIKLSTKSPNWRLNGNWSIKGFVPMMGENDIIKDVEVILNIKKNRYFSISMFLKDKSWVKEIVLKDDFDKRIKNIPVLLNKSERWMKPKHYKEVEKIISKFMKKCNK